MTVSGRSCRTPRSRQRQQRPWALCQSPKSGGRSRRSLPRTGYGGAPSTQLPEHRVQQPAVVLGGPCFPGPLILELDPPKATGRRRADPRQMLNGMIFRLRSGCQWNRLPRELGDDSTIHHTFQRWVELGVFPEIWRVLAAECAELGGVH